MTAEITADEIADILITGERDRKEVPQFSQTPAIDVETAYEAQKAFVQSKLDAGDRLVGYKLGLTSRNKQRAMGVDSPLYGRVTSSMMSTYGDPIPFNRFIHPRVESEIAFLLGKDIEAPATVTSVLAATELVYGAVDVLDSRYKGFKFTLTDVVADNASAGAFYLGPIANGPIESSCTARLRGPGGRRGRDDGGRCRGHGSSGRVGGLAGEPARCARARASRPVS